MQSPQIRPGKVSEASTPTSRVVAFFKNTAQGNLVIQLLTTLGVRNDQLGVVPPEQIETGQGMILSIACSEGVNLAQVEAICRNQGAEIHRQRS